LHYSAQREVPPARAEAHSSKGKPMATSLYDLSVPSRMADF
jgi:hypothetical protein